MATRIRRARVRAGYTQEKLANRLGVSRSAVANWETMGKNAPRIHTLCAMAAILDVTFDWLATGRSEDDAPSDLIDSGARMNDVGAGEAAAATSAIQSLWEDEIARSMQQTMDMVPEPLLLSVHVDQTQMLRQARNLYVNKAFIEKFGCTLERIPRMDDAFAHFFPDPMQRAQAEARWSASAARVGEHGLSGPEGEFMIRCAEGGMRWCRISMDMDRNLPGFCMTLLQDVHHYKSHVPYLDGAAHTDMLTGLANRWACEQALEHAWSSWETHGRQFAILLCDLDDLKRINDDFGQAAGDHVLGKVASLLKHDARELDMVSRWGGDEFLLVLPGVNRRSAAKIATRMSHAVATHDFIWQQQSLPVRLSIGCAASGRQRDMAELLALADRALYAAKRNEANVHVSGRNRELPQVPIPRL